MTECPREREWEKATQVKEKTKSNKTEREKAHWKAGRQWLRVTEGQGGDDSVSTRKEKETGRGMSCHNPKIK